MSKFKFLAVTIFSTSILILFVYIFTTNFGERKNQTFSSYKNETYSYNFTHDIFPFHYLSKFDKIDILLRMDCNER